MRILIATDTYYPSVNGAAYFSYRLANALAQKGHEIFVMCPSRIFKDSITIDKGVTIYGIRSIHIPVYSKFRMSPLILSRQAIRKTVKEISPDIVHVQNHFMIGKEAAFTAKNLGIPVVATNHFMPENLVHYFHLPKFAEGRLERFGWKQCVDVFDQLDFVTTPTQTAANLLKNAGLVKHITPVSCGLDLERFKPANNGAYLKKRYNIPTDRQIILYVGRLDKEKKVDVILRSLPLIQRIIKTHLVLAGIGNDKPKLEALVNNLDLQKSVTFTGFIPDADFPCIYTTGDVFVIASVAELQSIVTMEAMASGLPVVAVKAAALPELVHDGINGYLFPVNDSQTLARKIVAVLSDRDLRKNMSKASLEIIKQHDIKNTIEKYEEIYRKVLGR